MEYRTGICTTDDLSLGKKQNILNDRVLIFCILTGTAMTPKLLWTALICILLALIVIVIAVFPEATGKPATAASGTAAIPGTAGTISPLISGASNDRPGAFHTRLVLLGTAGGPTWYPDTDRAGTSSALVVGDEIYIIDMGQGSAARLARAFNTGRLAAGGRGQMENNFPGFLSYARALFITHLHMDHTADYPSLLLIGPSAGLGTSVNKSSGQTEVTPFKVFGPAGRGQLEADLTSYREKGGRIVSVDSADPALKTPSPGTRQMTCSTFEAYAQAINDMTLDNGLRDFTTLVEVHEIGGSAPGDIPLPVAVPDPNNGTCPAMDPFAVYRDANVRVTATLVDHHQVFPALAYRFDTADGSVVFSGDTGKETNGNLGKLADGADILVHEVIDPAWIDAKFGDVTPGSRMAALRTHMFSAHTTIRDAGSVATASRVKTLVLNHIIPGDTPRARLLEAQQTFSGRVIIGEDLMEIGVGNASG